MDPRDRLRARLVGSSRSVRGAPTARDRIRFATRRHELVLDRVDADAPGSEAPARCDFPTDTQGGSRTRIAGGSQADGDRSTVSP